MVLDKMSRRGLLLMLASTAAPFGAGSSQAAALPPVMVYRDPSCGCCESWSAYLRANGFAVTIISRTDMESVKARLKVPDSLISCHTAEIGGYVVEGHVPLAALRRLLDERPQVIGISAPGMPVGSPGMEGGGKPEAYDVVLFGSAGQFSYGRYLGDRLI
jgi:hypothetical protein